MSQPTQVDGKPHYALGRWFGVSAEQVDQLFRSTPNPGAFNKAVLFAVGLFLTPVTLTGALLGYIRAYNRFDRLISEPPTLAWFAPITRFAMVVGGVLIWVAVFIRVFEV